MDDRVPVLVEVVAVEKGDGGHGGSLSPASAGQKEARRAPLCQLPEASISRVAFLHVTESRPHGQRSHLLGDEEGHIPNVRSSRRNVDAKQ